MEARERADALLEDMGELTEKIRRLEAEAEAEIRAIQDRLGPQIQEQRAYLAGMEKDLVQLMKDERRHLFGAADRVTLDHGWLTHGWGVHVRIPRDALEKIEAQGWDEAIKIAKSVDRGVVEAWPVERLAAIGAEKKRVEKWEYEIKA